MVFTKDILVFADPLAEVEKIVSKTKENMFNLRKKGAIIGISGGIDSSLTLAIATKALGAENVTGILLPEKDSSPDSKLLALQLADQFGVKTIEEDITLALTGFGCYKRRDEAVCMVFPEYNPENYKMKIGLKQNESNKKLPPLFILTIVDNEGNEKSRILPLKEYLQIVAASNFKQRCRMSMLYYHAERLNYAVIGTPNKHEVEQGFFVKHGDGGADIMPIAHLYKTQVYQLAEFLNVPKEIIDRTPTTDTYSAEQTQEEFFFQIPFYEMDMIWYGFENGYNPAEVGNVMGKPEEEISLIYNNFKRKQKTTEYLRLAPIKF
ncbi:MAG: NAD(+) synthase [Prolixibacteraceae bacterium]|nr:NAD(+) synthase [Prolixibacteraceae bacterium]MBN2774884.1 NAD(+) synthase [Prolixibacteraceae bacterium]